MILVIASVALLAVYVTPLWSITLEAPQYPEGIGMYIWVNTITGKKAQDLQNINGLNHYIGMDKIEPDTIPELKIMPWVIALLIALGLATGAMGNQIMLGIWVGLFFVAAVVGLVDFYLWEYRYGHNLNDAAAIKVPGMNYQPPFIGAKQLLNFKAHSWPAVGGWIAFLSLFVGFTLVRGQIWRLITGFLRRRTRRRLADMRRFNGQATAVVLLLLAGCVAKPRPLVHGRDQCAYCRMTLVEERYGAEIVTRKGRVYPFDAIECMVAFRLSGGLTDEIVHSRWVVDYANPPQLISISEAVVVRSPDLPSPMGMDLTAFQDAESRAPLLSKIRGTRLNWQEVEHIVQKEFVNR